MRPADGRVWAAAHGALMPLLCRATHLLHCTLGWGVTCSLPGFSPYIEFGSDEKA